ncbi:glycosyltransferase [Mariniflexile sp. HMF6888]|uniref:glycosyltransferase n=1 Tax=Mariniflexile sp. HMF6888 TaxID=3373086 RepID=UPI0037AD8F58
MKLSLIICSRKRTISKELSDNIAETIGCTYELLIIDNSQNQYSIFEVYNLGIKKSNGSFLCFMHDDVLLHTKNWGTILQSIFNANEKVGLIGIAGAKVKTKMVSPWWNCHKDQQVINIIQHNKNDEPEKTMTGFDEGSEAEVVVIDGVFMALRKSMNIRFSEVMVGYHNYDLNISFECKKNGCQIMVTNQILIEHFSSGMLNKDWLSSTYKIHKMYKSILPLQVKPHILKNGDEIRNAFSFINQCFEFKKQRLGYLVWYKLFLLQPNFKYHFNLWKSIKNKI